MLKTTNDWDVLKAQDLSAGEIGADCVVSLRQIQIVDDALNTVKRISRTFQGVGDTSTSTDKNKLLLDGEDLAHAAASNFRSALEALLQDESKHFEKQEDVALMIEALVMRLNHGLTSAKHGFWRSWETPHGHPAPRAIKDGFDVFCREFRERYNDSNQDAVQFAAWIEREFNFSLHPLSDGCGRCSKALALFVLARQGISYPHFESRQEYFENISRPLHEWSAYYRQKIPCGMQ